MVSAKRTLLDSKSRLPLKFKRETAQTLKIYLVKVCGRDNKAIVWTMESVKQIPLDSKSRVGHRWYTISSMSRFRIQTRRIGAKTACRQLLHSAATTRCTQRYPTPFRVCIGGWVTRLRILYGAFKVLSCGFSWKRFIQKFWYDLPIAIAFLASWWAPEGQKRQQWLFFQQN